VLSIRNKKLFNNHLVRRVFGWVFISGLLLACQTPAHISETPSEPLNFKNILVLPFTDIAAISDAAMDTRCPVCGRVFIAGEVADDAENILTNKLVSWLQSNTNYQLTVSPLKKASLSSGFSDNDTKAAAKGVLADLGRRHGANAVLVGFVYRFIERVGKGYGAESPASVAFDMHLIRVADGRTIWSAHFDETQKSLGDNLFQLGTFLSRGGRWLTAEELASSGLEKILEKFPKS
jgi:hypothetical protein